MEDLTFGLTRPCIMDLKMGFRGHDDNAKTLKVVQQVALCTFTTTSSLGFRLCGMRYFDDQVRLFASFPAVHPPRSLPFWPTL